MSKRDLVKGYNVKISEHPSVTQLPVLFDFGAWHSILIVVVLKVKSSFGDGVLFYIYYMIVLSATEYLLKPKQKKLFKFV